MQYDFARLEHSLILRNVYAKNISIIKTIHIFLYESSR